MKSDYMNGITDNITNKTEKIAITEDKKLWQFSKKSYEKRHFLLTFYVNL